MNRVAVEPALLRWARARAGRSVESLLGRFPKLEAWERGELQPTLKQLERFARATTRHSVGSGQARAATSARTASVFWLPSATSNSFDMAFLRQASKRLVPLQPQDARRRGGRGFSR